jgi:uncharacterized phage protein (TIGR01671 family)
MREIKFRAWDAKTHTMNPSPIIWRGIWYESPESFEYDISSADVPKGKFLMQYTGFKDKDDREIYEGDIVVICALHPIEPVFTTEVKWDTGSFTANKRRLYRTLAHWAKDGIQVIGNIYENPELLAGVKDN